jgi:hypothetical protein
LARNVDDRDAKIYHQLARQCLERGYFYGFAEELGQEQKKTLLRGNLCA